MMRWDYIIPFAVAVLLAMLTWSTAVSADGREDATGFQGIRATYPSSVKSFIERRQDLRDRRHEKYLDLRSGRRWHQPPWVNAQRDRRDVREDAMREALRQRRDSLEQWHDSIGRWQNPWSQWIEDRNEARQNAEALNRLARDEYFDRYRYGRPWGYPF